MKTDVTLRGGAWLAAAASPESVFTRERLDDEQRMIGRTAEAFVDGEALPALERLEQKDWTLARTLVSRCADLGLLATDVPEEYGGLDLDKISSIVVGEAVGRCPSFATTFGAQTGLTITPILCFGTEAQKRRYLPRLVSGEIIGAYALSESGSGSDALGAKARASRQPDGSFVLTGEKMWITNGGFADVFIVFAKVDGEHFSAFIVERGFPGVSSGKEEHKLGLLGSSTTPLILQDAMIPAENLLGEIGKGHRIAFNTLNYGRLKLGAMCSGGGRLVIADAAKYAGERKQFGKPIASFGAIKQKIGDMIVRQYAIEAMLYRTVGLIDATLQDGHGPAQILAALEEFAIESSMVKVASSEAFDAIVDDNVQIHGGNGFVRDYAAERYYRDARVNRIFEGTNEINRLLIPTMAIRRAPGAGVDLTAAAESGPDGGSTSKPSPAEPLASERQAVTGMRTVALLVLRQAVRTFAGRLADQQEVLSTAADVMIDLYASESAVARAAQAGGGLHGAAARTYVGDALPRVERNARAALTAMCEDEALRAALARVHQLLDAPPADLFPLRRQLADAAVERRGYPF